MSLFVLVHAQLSENRIFLTKEYLTVSLIIPYNDIFG